jgi:hypothetical protein
MLEEDKVAERELARYVMIEGGKGAERELARYGPSSTATAVACTCVWLRLT